MEGFSEEGRARGWRQEGTGRRGEAVRKREGEGDLERAGGGRRHFEEQILAKGDGEGE